MVLTALAALGTIGSTIYNAVSSAEANRSAQAEERARHDRANALLYSDVYGDYTKRSEFQSIMTRMKDLADESFRREQGRMAVMGTTDTQAIAQKQANALAQAETMAQLGASASSYKDSAKKALMAEDSAHTQSEVAFQRQRAQNIAQATQGALNTMGALAQGDTNHWADDLAMFGLTDGLEYNNDTGHWQRKA